MEKYSIVKAISEKEKLENELQLKKEQKQQLFPLPKSSNLSNELVDGGIKEDKITNYLIKSQQLEIEIDQLEKEIKMLERYIAKEKARIEKYSEWEQKIIYMREEHYTFLQIACNVPYSIRQCKRIYAKYKKENAWN